LVVVACFKSIALGELGAGSKTGEMQAETSMLEGVLQVHPKYLFTYYLAGFADGQECALFPEEKLKGVTIGSRIRVEGRLGTRLYKGETSENPSAFGRTMFIFMEVDTITVLSQPPEVTAAANLKKLISRIESGLPSGWTVNFKRDRNRCRESEARLVIQSTQPLPLEYIGQIGAPAPSDDPDPSSDIVRKPATIDVLFASYLTPQEYESAKAENRQLQQKRRQFELAHLSRVRYGWKGPHPLPPIAYEAHSPKEENLLREYAFLWLSTEPRRLPTHHYATLAVIAYDLHGMSSIHIKIHDPAKDREYRELLKRLEATFQPYEKQFSTPQ
jgi:hypothetical protein